MLFRRDKPIIYPFVSLPKSIKIWLFLFFLLTLWESLFISWRPASLTMTIFSPFVEYAQFDPDYMNLDSSSLSAQNTLAWIDLVACTIAFLLMQTTRDKQVIGALLIILTQYAVAQKTLGYLISNPVDQSVNSFTYLRVYLVPNLIWLIASSATTIHLAYQLGDRVIRSTKWD